MSARKQRQSRLKDETKEASPFHILMAENGMPLGESRLRLKGRLKRDYLSKRHRLQQMCKPVSERETDTFWSGATPIELSLLSCCELPKQLSRHEDYCVPGALNRSKIPKFIGHAILDCHELSARALALAILERTWEADEEAKDLVEAYTEDGDAVALTSPSKKAKLNDESTRVIAKIGIQGKADRLLTFFAGGGLRVLNQWLVDASTPVFLAPPKSAPGEEKTGRPKRTPASEMWKPSKTGDLLLPLLILLTYSPFDKDLVTDSKINKQIAKLSKAADAIIADAQRNPGKINIDTYTDPKVGGLLVKDVQKSLNDLKASWRSKEKQKEEMLPTDPFARIKAALAARLEEAKQYDKGEIEKPKWLARVEESAEQKKPTTKSGNSKIRASTEELARLEREKERQEHLKGDLKKTAEERAKLLEKLRQLKQKQVQEKTESIKSRNQKKVQWKDGQSSISSARDRGLLEQIFVLHKDETPSASNSSNSEAPEESDGLQ